MRTLYLCGAINGCSDTQAREWREVVKDALCGVYTILDPMRRDYRGREVGCAGEIVEEDISDISTCDVVLVAADRPSWGTAMEVRIAHTELRKEVVTVCQSPSPSPWLVHHSSIIVLHLLAAIAHLRKTSGMTRGAMDSAHRRALLQSRGCCIECTSKPVGGGVRCQRHTDMHNARYYRGRT